MTPDTLSHFREECEVSFKADRDELSRCSISLDKDASAKSPAVLYNKLFMAREYTNRAGVIYSKFIKMHVLAKKLLLQKEEERRQALNLIFRENADVLAKFRSSEEKNRYCESLLSAELIRTYTEAKLFCEEADGYKQYFRLQFEFYKDIKSDILTQLGIIRSMMMLGDLPVMNSLTYERDVDITGQEEFNTEPIIGEGTISL